MTAGEKFYSVPLSVPHLERGSSDGWAEDLERYRCCERILGELESRLELRFGLPALVLSSATAALHLGLKLLRVQAGHEVVLPTFTYIASASPVLYERAVPVLCDSELGSWNLDPNLLSKFLRKRARVNRLPKAVIAVHVYGQSADLDGILDLCRRYEIGLIEDAAQSLGAAFFGRGRPGNDPGRLVGTFGDVGVYSFNTNKIVTCLGGGLLLARHRAWIEQARSWAMQSRLPGHGYVHRQLGYTYRMNPLCARLAWDQIQLLERRVAQRRAIAFRYRDAFADIRALRLMPQAGYGRPTNWLSCFTLDQRRTAVTNLELIRALAEAGIESRPLWNPLHRQPLLQGCLYCGGAVAERLHRTGFCLPSSSSLSLNDQAFVIQTVRSILERRPRNTEPAIPSHVE